MFNSHRVSFHRAQWVGRSGWAAGIRCLLLLYLCALGTQALAVKPVVVAGDENGETIESNLELWHDLQGHKTLDDALTAFAAGEFSPLTTSNKSLGLKPGAFWGHLYLTNPAAQSRTLYLEYVDHQLANLQAYQRSPLSSEGLIGSPGSMAKIAEFDINGSFSDRAVSHHRFVFAVTLEPGQTTELLVRYGTGDRGFIYPSLRVWSAENLRMAQTAEVGLLAFLMGGIVIMAMVSLTVGLATGEALFFAYCLYALSKIAMWWTMAGFTHQFIIPEHFHWRYISFSGALVITTGIWFARLFLKTRTCIPRFDRLLLLMLWCACLLVLAAWAEQKAVAVILITVLLLMYPLVSIAGLMRWYQGAREAAVFALAWAFLVAGLLSQALRDLGYVEHTLSNYYWPAVGSYTEMVVILFAMGVNLYKLRDQKNAAELRYLTQLEHKKSELETLVKERTRDLEAAKSLAEVEASTDPLTGANNRRSFFRLGTQLLHRSQRHASAFSLLMFDIDHFKAINDNFGHSVGDDALRLFARTLMAEIRDIDIFGRLGGEEFALLFSGTDDASLKTAERLRETVSKLSIPVGGEEITFTASVGVAHFGKEATLEELFYKADAALYEAKQEGRNRVKSADDI
ncbi:GGDEF domain-containing protein [Aestuariicella hydrocarbonica]|uniref:diguanylate cyclase n=1 Tax=Pseudomaricurvus hydrocarbonicus TaxID=1470433 RepID=A0A9E5T427_9GAMM|nr:diguanylate cyclase [Aestuariicella hydrocarbonica]NHO67504.1 GGDEF domain-containing protein [Aestuariicella hydrocarbonica]